MRLRGQRRRTRVDACTRGELGLDGRVEFVGFVEEHDLIRLLSSADVCLAPEPKNALNDASTMIKVVEYMGLGRPVVAYDLTETRFSAGAAALYASPNDESHYAACIEMLLDDSAYERVWVRRVSSGCWGSCRGSAQSWRLPRRIRMRSPERPASPFGRAYVPRTAR